MSEQDVRSAIRALEGRYLRLKREEDFDGPGHVWVLDITDDARRAVGMWPTAESVTDEIVAHLDQRIAATSDPERRTRWQRVRDAIGGATRDLAVDVIGSVVSRSITEG